MMLAHCERQGLHEVLLDSLTAAEFGGCCNRSL
jgi:hypothetical protein